MLLFFKKLALLTIPVAIALWLIGTYLNKRLHIYKLGRHTSKVHDILVNKKDTDIAIFGSSVAYVHFNPDIIEKETGNKVYNFGIDGTTLVQYKGMLKEYLNYSASNVVVIAGTASEFMPRTLINQFNNFKPYLDNENVFAALSGVDPELAWKSRYVPFYDFVYYDDEYRQILLGNFREYKWESEPKGFMAVHRQWSPAEVVNPDSARYIEIDERSIESYREVIEMANAKGKKVVLVLTPIFQEAQDVYANLDDIRDTYRALAGEDNYFLDFTTHPISRDRSLFYNYTHLNAEGAELFSKAFSDRLLELGVLQ